jgi:FkbM family methyltransferase
MFKEIIYKLIDVFTFGKGLKKTFTNKYKVRLPTRYINYFPQNYEQENFEFLASVNTPGAVVIDIGAHIGLFSVIASKIIGDAGKVYAFEPSPTTYSFLQQTISLNMAENRIETFQKAVSSKVGITKFYISEDVIDNSNSLVSYQDDRKLKGIDITLTTVDAFVEEKKISQVGFIKIDVEGAEYDTLRGAENTFKTLRPYCMVGIHPVAIKAKGDSLEDIFNFIKQCNYDMVLGGKKISRDQLLANNDLIDLHLYPL